MWTAQQTVSMRTHIQYRHTKRQEMLYKYIHTQMYSEQVNAQILHTRLHCFCCASAYTVLLDTDTVNYHVLNNTDTHTQSRAINISLLR